MDWQSRIVTAIPTAMDTKPKLAVWKFASCDGCQLSLLDCEDELLAVAQQLDIAHFSEASSQVSEGPFDLSLVEGSVSTPDDLERIQKVRQQSRFLVSIGACASAGGIQALRNYADISDYISVVYASPSYISTLKTSTPISQHVKVDFELRGCPIDKHQLLHVIQTYLQGRRPQISSDSVCVDCKRNQIPCLMVSQQQACLGPITHAGCDALCPRFNRACFGCFGPKNNCNTRSLTAWLQSEQALSKPELTRLLHTFNSDSFVEPEYAEE